MRLRASFFSYLVFVCSTLILLTAGQTTAAEFFTAPSYATGVRPKWVTTADFNADGVSDLAVANSGDNMEGTTPNGSVSVLLGRRDGTFRGAVNYKAGNHPVFVASVDLSNDRKLDLVVLNEADFSGKGSVSVLLGKGDGEFQTAIDTPAGYLLISAAFGDFNQDGRTDMAVGAHDGIQLFLGNGNGNFRAPIDLNLSNGYVASGDLNRDGKVDLVTFGPTCIETDYCIHNTLEVSLGNGDASFQASQRYPLSDFNESLSIALGDINGDNSLDVLVAQNFPYTINVLLNDGYGRLRPQTTYPAGVDPFGIAVGDIDGDGRADVVVGGDDVAVLLGSGAGSLQPGPNYAGGGKSVAIADFNGDGNADLAAVSDLGVTIMSGRADGAFSAIVDYPPGYGANSIDVGDFNGDGAPDLATANVDTNFSVLLNDGKGRFEAPKSFFAGADSTFSDVPKLAAGDFNNDGKLDVVVSHFEGSRISFVSGNGDGTFQLPLNYHLWMRPNFVLAQDFNADGNLDVALVGYTDPVLAVLLGSGDGKFKPEVDYRIDFSAWSVAAGDFDGDGKPDLVVGYIGPYPKSIDYVSVIIGNGDGSFKPAVSYPARTNPSSVTIGDFNGDGHLDIAAAAYGNNQWGVTPDGSVDVLFGNGNGTFHAPVSYLSGPKHFVIAAADFQGTGHPSLVVGDNNLKLLQNNGVGAFPRTEEYSICPAFFAVADFNRDSMLDLAAVNYCGSGVAVLLNTGPNDRRSATKLVSSANPSSSREMVTFSAEVSPVLQSSLPQGGTVTFTDGGIKIGTVEVVSGQASMTTPSLAPGEHDIRAFYSGDAGFDASVSEVLKQIVNEDPIPAPDFTVDAAPATITIPAGGSAQVFTAITPINGFSTAISLSCAGLPSFAKCSFSPTTLTPTNSVVTSVVTITNSTASESLIAAPTDSSSFGSGFLLLAAMMPLLGLLFCSSAPRSRRKFPFRVVIPALALWSALVLAGCAGKPSDNPSAIQPTVSPQTTTVVISAAPTGADASLVHTAAVSVTFLRN